MSKKYNENISVSWKRILALLDNRFKVHYSNYLDRLERVEFMTEHNYSFDDLKLDIGCILSECQYCFEVSSLCNSLRDFLGYKHKNYGLGNMGYIFIFYQNVIECSSLNPVEKAI